MTVWWVQLLLVAAGGAVGGAARHLIAGWVGRRTGERFPWGTGVVNISGALALGCLLGIYESQRTTIGAGWLLLGVGVLGSYTTVSSLSLQALLLARAGRLRDAAAYVSVSLVAGVLAVFAGLCLGSAG